MWIFLLLCYLIPPAAEQQFSKIREFMRFYVDVKDNEIIIIKAYKIGTI